MHQSFEQSDPAIVFGTTVYVRELTDFAKQFVQIPQASPAGRTGRRWPGWITPGTLEALIPGRMQGHGGTEEVPG